MHIHIKTDRGQGRSVEKTVEKVSENFEDARIEIQNSDSDERLFPALEDPTVQRILIIGGIEVTKLVYQEIRRRLEEDGVEFQVDASDIERLKWNYMKSETGLEEDELEVVNTFTPIDPGSTWIYEFKDKNDDRHLLSINTDDLTYSYEVK